MAPMMFTRAILAGEPIKVFNHGKHAARLHLRRRHRRRRRARAARPPRRDRRRRAPHAIYNIGNHSAVELETFIAELERLLGKRAIREYLPLQPGDVPATFASIERLAAATGFAPTTPLADGLARFVAWYREYYAPVWRRRAEKMARVIKFAPFRVRSSLWSIA